MSATAAGSTTVEPPRFDPYRQYRSTLLSPQRVRELSRLRPVRCVLDTAWCWLWIIGAWAAVAAWTQWWVVLLAIPVIGTRYYALTTIAHDGFHRRLFADFRRNDLFNDACILGAIGLITRMNNVNHLRHHRYLATDEDPDRHKYCCFNKTNPLELLGYITGATSIFNSARHVLLAGRIRPASGEQRADRYRLRDLVILLGWQVALITGLTLAVGWWAYPVLWILPVYAFTFLGDGLRSFAEHSHPENDRTADEHRMITYLSNPIERLFLAPMNMNYHAAHHLWPSIPYYNLPVADGEMRGRPGAEGLEWRRSYIGYLYRYLRAMPLDECRQRPPA